jgi:hypothetical protein
MKKTFKNLQIISLGLAGKMHSSSIAAALANQEFTLCSGKWEDNEKIHEVHSMYGAKFVVNGKPLVAYADTTDAGPKSQPVHVYFAAEMAVANAVLGLDGATPNVS